MTKGSIVPKEVSILQRNGNQMTENSYYCTGGCKICTESVGTWKEQLKQGGLLLAKSKRVQSLVACDIDFVTGGTLPK